MRKHLKIAVESEDQGSTTEGATPPTEQINDPTLATEGFKGAVLGALAGLFGLGLSGAIMSNQVERNKKEIESLAAELEKAAIDNGKKAVEEGKLSAEDFKKHVKVGGKGVIWGVINGTLFGPIYGAIKGSELEDLRDELEAKCNQLNRLLEKAKKNKKVATESEELAAPETTDPAASSEQTSETPAASDTHPDTASTDPEHFDDANQAVDDAVAAAAAADKPAGEEGGEKPAEGETVDTPAADDAPAATDVPAADAPAADAPAADAAAAPAGDTVADTTTTGEGGEQTGSAAEEPYLTHEDVPSFDAETTGTEEAVKTVAADAEEDAGDTDTVETVLESMNLYGRELRQLIDSKSGTPATLGLIRMGLQQQLNRVGFELPVLAQESADDIVRQHELTLEGAADAWKRIKQGFMLGAINNQESFDDVIERIQKVIGRSSGALDAAEYDLKEAKFDGKTHQGSMTQLWQFFSNAKGPVKDFPEKVAKDAEFSAYVLGVYSKDVGAELAKLAALLDGVNPATDADIVKLAAKVEQIKVPLELFEQKWVQEDGYLGGHIVEVKHGTERNVLSLNGKSFPKLAKLATRAYVVSSVRWKHIGKGALRAGPFAGAVEGALGKSDLEYSTKDIELVIKGGRAYLAALQQYLKTETPAHAAFQKIRSIDWDKLEESDSVSADGAAVLMQIKQVMDTLFFAFRFPAIGEVYRCLAGARWCGYAADRMVIGASKEDKKAAVLDGKTSV